MKFSKLVLGVGATLLAVSAAGSAHARLIVIDSNPFTPITPCSIGTPCAATPLGFNADFGGGSFSGLYVYDNGLVSFGSEISAGADLSALSTIGSSVFTAGYSSGMTLSNFAVASDNTSFGTVTDAPVQFDIYDLGGGDFVLQFDYGDGSFLPDIADDAYLGYHIIGGGSLQLTNQRADVQANSPTSYRYFLPGRNPAVPEPGTWAMMIVGFGMAGIKLRRSVRQVGKSAWAG
jgi:hypothetical protein